MNSEARPTCGEGTGMFNGFGNCDQPAGHGGYHHATDGVGSFSWLGSPASPEAPTPHEPGDNHQYDLTCSVCGERGLIRISIDPQTLEERLSGQTKPTPEEMRAEDNRAAAEEATWD